MGDCLVVVQVSLDVGVRWYWRVVEQGLEVLTPSVHTVLLGGQKGPVPVLDEVTGVRWSGFRLAQDGVHLASVVVAGRVFQVGRLLGPEGVLVSAD